VPSPFAPAVRLTEDERAQLVAWSRRSKSANALAMRSRIVLAAADGLGNTAIADKLDIHVSSARKWRSRFVADRLEGLLDEPRPASDSGRSTMSTSTAPGSTRDSRRSRNSAGGGLGDPSSARRTAATSTLSRPIRSGQLHARRLSAPAGRSADKTTESTTSFLISRGMTSLGTMSPPPIWSRRNGLPCGGFCLTRFATCDNGGRGHRPRRDGMTGERNRS
jgi:Homeodomain-like domain